MENLNYKNYSKYKYEIPKLFLAFKKSDDVYVQPYSTLNVYFVKTNQFRDSSITKSITVINPKRNGDYIEFHDWDFKKRYLTNVKYPLNLINSNPFYTKDLFLSSKIQWDSDIREL